MSYAARTYITADGVEDTFAVPFPYIKAAHVTVTVDDLSVGFTWATSSSVTLDEVPAAGQVVGIVRVTPRDALPVTYRGGSIGSLDLNLSGTYALYWAQEDADEALYLQGLLAIPGFELFVDTASDLPNPALTPGLMVYIRDENLLSVSNGERFQRHITRNYLEDFGGKAGDTAAVAARNRLAILDANSNGLRPTLRANSEYALDAQTAIAAGTGIIGEPGSGLVMLGSGFSNTATGTAAAASANGNLLDLSGGLTGPFTPATDILLEGFRIRYSGPTNRSLTAIKAWNNNNLHLRGLTLQDFPIGFGIHLESQQGQWSVQDITIRNFYSNDTFAAGAQTTGILIGDSPVNSVVSEMGRLSNIDVYNLTFGPALVAAQGKQTDAVNIQQHARHIMVSDLRARLVDEGVDCFADWVTVTNFDLWETRGAGLKVIHGSTGFKASHGQIIKWGLWGIVIAGSNSRAQDVTLVHISDVNVTGGGDWEGYWATAGATSSALAFVDPSVGQQAVARNCLVSRCLLDGTGGKYAVQSSDDGTQNRIVDCQMVAGSSGLALVNSGVTIQAPVRTRISARMAVAQTVLAPPSTNTANLLFGTELIDTNAEFNPATGFITVVGTPKTLRVVCDIRLSSPDASGTYQLALVKDGIEQATTIIRGTASDLPITVDAVVSVTAGNVLRVVFTNNGTTSQTIPANTTVTRLEVTEVQVVG